MQIPAFRKEMVLAMIQAGNWCMRSGSAKNTLEESSMRQQHPGSKED